jgi:hypothetical protein
VGVGKFLLVIIVFAALVYSLFWLIERRRGAASGGRVVKPTPRSLGPDDDEDFLRDLNKRNRHPDQDTPSD